MVKKGLRKKPIIFCDFDGTITMKDNIVAIMKAFAPSEWSSIIEQILGQEISVREGVSKLFSLLPSSQKEDIISFALEQAEIRPGFDRFLEYIDVEQIPFYVVSGGIDFFVDPILKPFGLHQPQVYRNESDFSGERVRIVWPYPCDEHCDVDCGLCKTSIIRSYPNEQYFKIMIGDSITDLAGAKLADFVFARGYLLEKCQQLGLRYQAYETFDDILTALQTKPWEYQPVWDELTEVKELFAKRDWFPGTSGNLSIKVDGEPLKFLVTASGKDKGKTTNEDFLLVNEESKPCYSTHLKPSAETLIHAEIYKRMEAGAVFHVHTIYNNLVSDIYLDQGEDLNHAEVGIENIELIKAFNIWEEGATIKIPIVPNYADIPKLTEEISKVLDSRVPGVLIHNHGIYAWGKNAFEAKKHLEAFEFLFEYMYKRLLFQGR
jgi:2-hydroxy-3-keto-5-methylthiopentenyl-1-phosphate phosphatase/methylthioribulose-1-phosphate dehydratase